MMDQLAKGGRNRSSSALHGSKFPSPLCSVCFFLVDFPAVSLCWVLYVHLHADAKAFVAVSIFWSSAADSPFWCGKQEPQPRSLSTLLAEKDFAIVHVEHLFIQTIQRCKLAHQTCNEHSPWLGNLESLQEAALKTFVELFPRLPWSLRVSYIISSCFGQIMARNDDAKVTDTTGSWVLDVGYYRGQWHVDSDKVIFDHFFDVFHVLKGLVSIVLVVSQCKIILRRNKRVQKSIWILTEVSVPDAQKAFWLDRDSNACSTAGVFFT